MLSRTNLSLSNKFYCTTSAPVSQTMRSFIDWLHRTFFGHYCALQWFQFFQYVSNVMRFLGFPNVFQCFPMITNMSNVTHVFGFPADHPINHQLTNRFSNVFQYVSNVFGFPNVFQPIIQSITNWPSKRKKDTWASNFELSLFAKQVAINRKADSNNQNWYF